VEVGADQFGHRALTECGNQYRLSTQRGEGDGSIRGRAAGGNGLRARSDLLVDSWWGVDLVHDVQRAQTDEDANRYSAGVRDATRYVDHLPTAAW
jgi:hypothetical protein